MFEDKPVLKACGALLNCCGEVTSAAMDGKPTEELMTKLEEAYEDLSRKCSEARDLIGKMSKPDRADSLSNYKGAMRLARLVQSIPVARAKAWARGDGEQFEDKREKQDARKTRELARVDPGLRSLYREIHGHSP